MDTMVEHLSVITSGPIPPNPSEMLGLRDESLVQEWKEHYDVILFDTPPVLAVTDALKIQRRVLRWCCAGCAGRQGEEGNGQKDEGESGPRPGANRRSRHE